MLNKHNLNVAEFATKEESRYTLSAIQVTPEATIATDGHRLVHVTTPKEDPANFPQVNGVHPTREFTPFLLHRDHALKILKTLPSKSVFPILKYAVIGTESEDNGRAVIATVGDLDNPQVFQPRKLDGKFPDWTLILPKKENAVMAIAVNGRYLATLAKAAAEFTEDTRNEQITLYLYGPNKQFLIEALNSDTGQVWTGIIMPQKGDGELPNVAEERWRRIKFLEEGLRRIRAMFERDEDGETLHQIIDEMIGAVTTQERANADTAHAQAGERETEA